MRGKKLKHSISRSVMAVILAFSMVLTSMAAGTGMVPVEAAELSTENLALGKPVTASHTGEWGSVPSRVTDGMNQANDDNTFFIVGKSELKYVTIDLEDVYQVDSIMLYGEIPADAGYFNLPHNSFLSMQI